MRLLPLAVPTSARIGILNFLAPVDIWSVMSQSNDSLLDHAWRHFDFHAKQRLSLFNFCIIWAGLVIAAWSQAMTGTTPRPLVGATLGILLVISSIVFWRMDQRNAHLTKLAEGVLSEAENATFGATVLFNSSEVDTQLRKGLRFLTAAQWSHGQSLRVLFSLMAVAGLMGTAFAWTAHYQYPPKPKGATTGNIRSSGFAKSLPPPIVPVAPSPSLRQQ